MIHATEGAASPYYAGLTLVLMVLAVVLDWTFLQSVVSVLLVLMLYLLASLPSASGVNFGIFLNNLFFLVFPGIAIIVGRIFTAGSGSASLSSVANWTRAARRWKQVFNNSRKMRCSWCKPRSWRRSDA